MHKVGTGLAFVLNKFFILFWVIVVLVGLPFLGVSSVLTDEENVKQVLADADVYSTVPNNVLKIVTADENEKSLPQEENNAPKREKAQSLYEELKKNGIIDPDALSNSFKTAFDGEFLENQVGTIIDSAYVVLSGESDDLKIAINISERSDKVVAELRTLLEDALDKAPVCPKDALVESDFDILNLDCFPSDAKLDEEIDNFINELTADDGLLADTITEDDLGVSATNLAFAKVAYGGLSLYPLLFWLVVIGLSLTIVTTARSVHFGFKLIGVMFVIFGVLFVVTFSPVASSAIDVSEFAINEDSELTEQQQAAILDIVAPLSDEFISKTSQQIVVPSAIMIFLGVASFIFGMYLSRHRVEHLAFHQSELMKGDDSIYPEATKGRSKPVPKEAQSKENDKTKNDLPQKSQVAKPIKKKRPPKKIQ